MKKNAELARKLSARRAETGLSFNRVTQLAYERLGAFCPTLETIRTYHDPERVPDQANPVLVAALAAIYDCQVIDLSESVDEDVKRVRDLLIDRSGWTSRTLQPAA